MLKFSKFEFIEYYQPHIKFDIQHTSKLDDDQQMVAADSHKDDVIDNNIQYYCDHYHGKTQSSAKL